MTSSCGKPLMFSATSSTRLVSQLAKDKCFAICGAQFYTMADSVKRVLVHIMDDCQSRVQADFTQSVLDAFHCPNECHEMGIYASLQCSQLILSSRQIQKGDKSIKIKRPSFCPIHHLTPALKAQLSEDARNRGIDVGVATIVESSDGKVLLTRRAAHLRTFPGVWVPPGGHVEAEETLHQAGLRELQEETGLSLSPEQCQDGDIPLLAMWESVFPPMLSIGLPKRHHIVVYMHLKLGRPLTSELLQSKMAPDPGEVGATTWLDRATISAIVRANDEQGTSLEGAAEGLAHSFRGWVVGEDGGLTEKDMATAVMLRVADGDQQDKERVSTGTKFALGEWLKASV